ncbi:DEKNAAC102169 [Brettanomyces naardenensis]|uniref:Cysteine synthase 1 n=1 Tax=Brettanomyces naardenensis TaxID=13370 RepID=A0A448YJS6_BRENA|nr:DEKNAAC102169 [Brettanomyces naardenensis]
MSLLHSAASLRSVASLRSATAVRYLSYNFDLTPAVTDGFAGAVGNTPLIRLRSVSEETGANIFAKAEWMNPGGSVKDRAALWLLEKAEERGEIRPGGTVVEGSAGNTGIALAHMARAKGYHCVIYMPDTMAPFKMQTVRMLGAEVRPVPVVPFADPMNFNHQAERYAKSLDNALYTNQFFNLDNRQAHMDSTATEIWKQLNGKVDAFTCSSGSGGTWSGVTHFLKDKNPNIKSYLASPPGDSVYPFVKSGGISIDVDGESVTEGIGQHYITGNVASDVKLADGAFFIPDKETITMLFRLIDEEGIFVGSTAALNIVAATKAAKKVPAGSNVVTIFTDSGHKYATKYFSKSFLQEHDLYDFLPEHLKKYAAMP